MEQARGRKLCAAVKAVGLGDWKTIATVYMRGPRSERRAVHAPVAKSTETRLSERAFCEKEKEDKVIVDCLREGGPRKREVDEAGGREAVSGRQGGRHA